MSELDKYSRHDPLAKHSSRPKQAKLTVADTDAWLAKNGNGMSRMPNKAKIVTDAIWSDYGKQSVATLIWRCINANGVVVPADISNTSCQRSVTYYCRNMVANGELEVFTVERHTNDPMRAESGSKRKVNAYRRA